MNLEKITPAMVVAALLVPALSLALPPAETASILWLDYESGLSAARESGRPVFINFTADWCHFCKKMKKLTYSDPAVIAYLAEHYVTVEVDTMKDRERAAQFRARSIPVIWFLSSDGEAITSLPGFRDAPFLLDVLGFIATGYYKEMEFSTYVDSVGGPERKK